MIADLLLRRLEQTPLSQPTFVFPSSCFEGLDRLLEVVIDNRYKYLFGAIVELATDSSDNYEVAFHELSLASKYREDARRSILKARFQTQNILFAADERFKNQTAFLADFREYCRAVFLALDHLQQVWVHSGNVEYLLLKMYDYLYKLYPPQFPAILESTLTEEEIEMANRPALR